MSCASDRMPAVHILSLARPCNDLIFVRLGELPRYSHVHLFSGDFIVCGLKDDLSIPHLVNWRTSVGYPLAGMKPTFNVSVSKFGVHGLNSLAVQGVILACSIWKNFLIIFNRMGALRIFGLPSHSASSLELLQTIEPFSTNIGELLDVSDYQEPSDSALESKILETGIVYSHSFLAVMDRHVVGILLEYFSAPAGLHLRGEFRVRTIHLASPPDIEYMEWYRFVLGSSGQRAMWITNRQDDVVDYGLISTGKQGLSQDYDRIDDCFKSTVVLSSEQWEASATLKAFPQIDFDDALGLVVVGNLLGELAVVDYVNAGGVGIWDISEDISTLSHQADEAGTPVATHVCPVHV